MPPAVFPAVSLRKDSKLKAEHLPEILLLLETLSFDAVGYRYGVRGDAIRYLLVKNGIDPKQYAKPTVTPTEFRDPRELAKDAEKVLEAGWPRNEVNCPQTQELGCGVY